MTSLMNTPLGIRHIGLRKSVNPYHRKGSVMADVNTASSASSQSVKQWPSFTAQLRYMSHA